MFKVGPKLYIISWFRIKYEIKSNVKDNWISEGQQKVTSGVQLDNGDNGFLVINTNNLMSLEKKIYLLINDRRKKLVLLFYFYFLNMSSY